MTESYTYDDYRQKHPDRLVLFAFNESGRLRFPVEAEEFKVPAGWKVTALLASAGDDGPAAKDPPN